MIKLYSIPLFNPLSDPRNESILKRLQKLDIKEIGWDFEFLFRCDNSLEPKLIELAREFDRNLRIH